MRYTSKEFADDILESREEIEKIIEYGQEPSQKIIDSICEKYSIPKSEFKTEEDREIETFIRAKENKEYIKLAMYAKKVQFPLDKIKAFMNLY